jgi:hypothetical protein
MFWLLAWARIVDSYRAQYGEDVFNEAVELCRTSVYTLEDCLEMCKIRKYRELILNF